MKKIVLTAADWITPQDAHKALKEALSFPEYYGNNLDALHDCLTDITDTCIIIEECARAADQMGDKWSKFQMVFSDACAENPTLDIQLVQGSGDDTENKRSQPMKYLDTLLEKYQIRKTRDQKTAFLSWAQEEIKSMGYECRVEEYEKDVFKCRNLIVGDPENAKVIYTAHYDTQPVMPLPNMVFPKNTLATLGAQLPLFLILIILFSAGVSVLSRLTADQGMLSFLLTEGWILLILILFMGLLFFGPANKHTANDNTSGTACLMEMMARLPEEDRKTAAFIFFDQEEKGKIGSLEFAKKYPEIKKNGFVFNLDCIGDGRHMLIVAPKKTPHEELTALENLFKGNDEFIPEAIDAKHASYNSDQRSFMRGYAIAALHLHPTFGLHLKRIHTKRDTICEKENLQYVMDGCLKLLKKKTEEI